MRKGYKQTEVGVIPRDWEVKPLALLSNEIGDGIHSTPEYVDSSNYYFVNGNNLLNGKIFITKDTKCVSKEEHKLLKKRLNNTTILMSINGTIGNLAIYKNETIVLGKSAAYINLKEDIEKIFIYCMLQSSVVVDFYENELTGTTIRNLSLKSIRETPIPLPPTKAEQTAIANTLSDADALIQSLEILITKKRLIKQGAMQELLKPKEGWAVKKLRDFLDYEQPTKYLVAETDYNNNNDTPVLTAGKTFILGYTSEELGIYKEDLPVIIFDDFTTAIKYVDFPFKAKSSAMKILKPKNKKVNLMFIFNVMQLIRFPLSDHKRYWISEYQNIDIRVPKSEEQNRIATILSDMDAEISSLETKLAKYKQIKQGKMQNLLTGRIRLI